MQSKQGLVSTVDQTVESGDGGRTPFGAEQSFEEVDGKVNLDEFV